MHLDFLLDGYTFTIHYVQHDFQSILSKFCFRRQGVTRDQTLKARCRYGGNVPFTRVTISIFFLGLRVLL